MKNIVWLASYPKSGNTWFRVFLSNYFEDKEEPVGLNELKKTSIASSPVEFEELTGLNPFEMYPDEVDLYRPDLYRAISNSETCEDGFLFKKTHDAYTRNKDGKPLFPKDVSIATIYFIRNPLDVCVSYANHESKSTERLLEFILNEKSYLSGKRSGQLRQILL